MGLLHFYDLQFLPRNFNYKFQESNKLREIVLLTFSVKGMVFERRSECLNCPAYGYYTHSLTHRGSTEMVSKLIGFATATQVLLREFARP